MASHGIRLARPDEAGQLTEIARHSKAHWGYSQDLLDLWADDLAVLPEEGADDNVWDLLIVELHLPYLEHTTINPE